jgi:hypothetical protein
MNRFGKSSERYSPLHKSEALRVVEAHFGVVNEATLNDIQKRIGRRPTRQCVNSWVRHSSGHLPRNSGAADAVSRPDTPGNKASPGNEAALQQAIEAAERLDSRTTDEKLVDILDLLISIPAEQVNRMPVDRRLRLFQPLSESWQRRKEIPPQVFEAMPELKALIEFLDNDSPREGWTLKQAIRMMLDVCKRLVRQSAGLEAIDEPENELIDVTPEQPDPVIDPPQLSIGSNGARPVSIEPGGDGL